MVRLEGLQELEEYVVLGPLARFHIGVEPRVVDALYVVQLNLAVPVLVQLVKGALNPELAGFVHWSLHKRLLSGWLL